MEIDKASLDKVTRIVEKQSIFSACLGGALWGVPSLALWFFVYSSLNHFSTIMLVFNGIIIGAAVRFHGKGAFAIFSFIALIIHTWISLVALALNIVINGTTWGIILFGCYSLGAIAAIFIARINIAFEDHRAFSFILKNNNRQVKLLNRWFIAFPVLILTLLVVSLIASVSILILDDTHRINKEINLQKRVDDKEIDISKSSLNNLKTHDILLYAYAYQKGLLFNKAGTQSQLFNKSEYKAKTLLNYLITNRNNARAKFILGNLLNTSIGDLLIQESMDQGDQYARLYYLIDYGCHTDREQAIKLLVGFEKLTKDNLIKEEISSTLYVGFPDSCVVDEVPEFVLSHVINYKEQ